MTTPASVSDAVAATATYAEGLCTSIDQWQQSPAEGNKTFQDAINGNPTPQDVKDALEAYMTSAVQDTQSMLDDIHALGSLPASRTQPPPSRRRSRT